MCAADRCIAPERRMLIGRAGQRRRQYPVDLSKRESGRMAGQFAETSFEGAVFAISRRTAGLCCCPMVFGTDSICAPMPSGKGTFVDCPAAPKNGSELMCDARVLEYKGASWARLFAEYFRGRENLQTVPAQPRRRGPSSLHHPSHPQLIARPRTSPFTQPVYSG